MLTIRSFLLSLGAGGGFLMGDTLLMAREQEERRRRKFCSSSSLPSLLLLPLLLLAITTTASTTTAVTTTATRGLQDDDTCPEYDEEDIIIRPLVTPTTNPLVEIIYLQGADINTTAYLPIAQQLQASLSSDFEVWIAIPHFPNNMALPDVDYVSCVMARVEKRMVEAGMNSSSGGGTTSSRFMMGHSEGGATSQIYSHQLPQGVSVGTSISRGGGGGGGLGAASS